MRRTALRTGSDRSHLDESEPRSIERVDRSAVAVVPRGDAHGRREPHPEHLAFELIGGRRIEFSENIFACGHSGQKPHTPNGQTHGEIGAAEAGQRFQQGFDHNINGCRRIGAAEATPKRSARRLPRSKGKNKRGQKQVYLYFAEREYLRQSQIYEIKRNYVSGRHHSPPSIGKVYLRRVAPKIAPLRGATATPSSAVGEQPFPYRKSSAGVA